jgi:hypothetical protein
VCVGFILQELMPPELRRILRIFQFSGLFVFAIIAAFALKLVLLLCRKELQFQFVFQYD